MHPILSIFLRLGGFSTFVWYVSQPRVYKTVFKTAFGCIGVAYVFRLLYPQTQVWVSQPLLVKPWAKKEELSAQLAVSTLNEDDAEQKEMLEKAASFKTVMRTVVLPLLEKGRYSSSIELKTPRVVLEQKVKFCSVGENTELLSLELLRNSECATTICYGLSPSNIAQATRKVHEMTTTDSRQLNNKVFSWNEELVSENVLKSNGINVVLINPKSLSELQMQHLIYTIKSCPSVQCILSTQALRDTVENDCGYRLYKIAPTTPRRRSDEFFFVYDKSSS